MMVLPTRLSDCHPNRKHYARGLCRSCYDKQPGRVQKIRANGSRWAKKNPEKVKHSWMKLAYGITYEDFNSILESQGGVCAICKQTGDEHWKPCIDHCHNTKKVRGLLCRNCNVGIGQFSDDPILLRTAAEYLDKSVKDI